MKTLDENETRQSMQAFIRSYREAFDSLDPEKITDLYVVPCSTSDGDGVSVFSSRQLLLRKFNQNCDAMVRQGYQSSQFNLLNVIEMGDTTNTTIVGWRVLLKDSELEFRASYVCHKSNEAWRIFNATVYAGSFENTS